MAVRLEFRSLYPTARLIGLLLISLISASRYSLAITDPSDVQALQAMYSSLNSSPQLIGWKSSGGDPCAESWKGITWAGSAVVSIDVSGLGLNGTMGYALASLLSLKKLNLAGNNLSGNLPYSFYNMVSLNYMNISQLVMFSPTLPTLDLSFNNFSGSLPDSFSSLSNLSSLYLENNQLTGSLDMLTRLTSIITIFRHGRPEFRPPMSEVVQALVRLVQRASVMKRHPSDEAVFAYKTSDHDAVDGLLLSN